MEIKNLNDVKEALKDMPSDVLKQYGAGFFEDEYAELLCFADEIDEVKVHELITKHLEKHKTLADVNRWIVAISQITIKCLEDESYYNDEPISSKDINI